MRRKRPTGANLGRRAAARTGSGASPPRNSQLINGHRTNHQSRTASADDDASFGVAGFAHWFGGGVNNGVYSDAVSNAGSDHSVNRQAADDACRSYRFNPLDCQLPAELFQRDSD